MNFNIFQGIGCICDPGFNGEFCEITTTVAPATTNSETNTDDYDYDYSKVQLSAGIGIFNKKYYMRLLADCWLFEN